jgi:hypothetical protein
VDSAALTQLLLDQLRGGAIATEITDPRPLPEGIHPRQIRHYFEVGSVQIGLVLQPSQNVVPDLPVDFTPSFVGLVASASGGPWRRYLALAQGDPTDRLNPYFLWMQDGRLTLSLVDQRGAGSGEGIMRLAQLTSDGAWQTVGCYSFGAAYRGPEDGDYLAFSRDLARQSPLDPAECWAGGLTPAP